MTSPLQRFDLDRWPWALAAYSAVAALVCFWRLGATGVIHMEGMVADGARHMLASGDWLVPRVYGEIYTYKPAMAYWLAALARSIADPPPEWLLRLPFTAVMFAAGFVVLFLVGRLAGPRTGSVSAIAMVSGVVVIEKLRLAEFDGLTAAGIGVAMVAACYNLAAERARGGVWVLGYLGLTIGFLTKGAPALMLFPLGAVGAAWATRRLRRLFEWRHLGAALLFLLLAGGYLAAVYRSAGPAAFAQPIAESKLRGFTLLSGPRQEASLETDEPRLDPEETATLGNPIAALGRTAAKPLLVLAAFLPWSLLIPFLLTRRGRDSGSAAANLLARAAGAFLICGVLIFMAVPTHAMRYYMPLCVPAGILAGIAATGPLASRPVKRQGMLLASAGAAVLLSALALVSWFLLQTPTVPIRDRVTLVVVGALALAVVVAAIRGQGRDTIMLLTSLAALCLFGIHTLGLQPLKESKRNLQSQAEALAGHLPEHEPVWILGPSDAAGKDSSLYFYLDRPILAFRPGGRLPPPGSYCILTSNRLGEVEGAPGFFFEPIARAEHPWRDYLLGRCSWTSPQPS